MSIIQFLKIIKKNIIIILIVPVLLSSMVWFFTRNEILFYESGSTIFTGVASGLSMEALGSNRVDFMGSKIEFDNILNIFKARETHKEVALRLFAQGLSLSSWDPRYISRTNYIRLQESTPQYIKNLVLKPDSTSLDRLLGMVPKVKIDTSILNNARLISGNKYYVANGKETLFELSNQFDVSVSELMDWNRLTSTTIELGQKLIVTKEKKVVYTNQWGNFDTTNFYIPDTSFFIKANIDTSGFEQSVRNLRAYAEADDTNYIYRLLNKGHLYYSISSISKNKAARIQGSDLVKITYESPDPGITQQTLNFLIFSFQKYYRKLKENQSDRIVSYFEQRVKESSALLIAAENRLLNFNQDNNIINYYEQTRHISDQKEQLDKSYYDEKIKFVAADSVIKELEKNLHSLRSISGINRAILEQRNTLSDLTYKIAINELNDNKDPKAINAIAKIREQANQLKKDINKSLDSLFAMQYTKEGINEVDILSNWLKKVIEYEESKATLAALYERKKEFQKTYEVFAPLGAKLKRIEREIDIYERQYMEHLTSLNKAKLKQQNLEFRSNIKVIDPPYFPLRPKGSKRTLFIIAAFVVGLILVLFIIMALEYFDETMKVPLRASKFIGIEPTSAFPVLLRRKKTINFEFLIKRSVLILHQNIVNNVNKDNNSSLKPQIVLFFSTQRTDGKSLIMDEYTHELRTIGNKVLMINYKFDSYKPQYFHVADTHEDNVLYKVDPSFFNLNSINQLLEDEVNQRYATYDFVVIEIPSIVHYAYPPQMIKSVDHSVMVIRANRTWQKSDKLGLIEISKILKNKPLLLLNGVNPEYMQDFVGEIPKKRSRIRRIIKKIVRLQVFERYQVKK
jgi:uncharacterized protein involved in exopolysaccharide biosynthesis